MQTELLQSTGASHKHLRLDPRTKLFIALITNTAAFSGNVWYLMVALAAIPLSLLFASNKIKSGVYCTLAYIIAVLLNELVMPATHGIPNLFIAMVATTLYRMMPGLIMGYYLVTTTTVSEFVASMERMHLSQKIIIPMSVMFRFFPTIGEEARAIGDAMRMRGIGLGSGRLFKKPMAMLEYRMVPLLMSTVKIGDELSAASLTRGLGGPVKRTNVCEIGFGVQDIAILIIGILIFIAFTIN
ncbi:energy-coupling factor transport system permease protein [Anaerobacterium chartisolvens]|uniref:Energy-coupling factor transport system permease protein n=2 Tax=Anaerobacterium chartisolvens TaxID=1297424 RepID=A0A369BCW8_9FIRM|nr:energy-coupling factor transport system permease protein [Anaerobacterium chartisolvens]